MNLLLFDENEFENGHRIKVRGRRSRHVRDVLRASEGDEIKVGLLGGRMGRARVGSWRDDELTLTDIRLDRDPPQPLPITLLCALPRPKALKRVIATATTLGVKRLIFFNAYRVEKSFWHCEQIRPDSVREAIWAGLEQAVDTVPPEIIWQRRFKPFVEDELPALISGTRAIVAHPLPLDEGLKGARETSDHVTLAIGPEGGFIPYEIENLVSIGFEPLSLGARILKTETALTFTIARLVTERNLSLQSER